MNIKGLMQPLGEKIGELTGLVQDMTDNLNAQTEIQQKNFHQLELINEKIERLIAEIQKNSN